MCLLPVHDKPSGEHPRAHSSAQEGAALQVQVLRKGIHFQWKQEIARGDQDLPQEVQGFGRVL